MKLIILLLSLSFQAQVWEKMPVIDNDHYPVFTYRIQKMKITIDTRDIDKLTVAMKQYGGIMPVSKVNTALRRSVKPMLRRTQAEVPVYHPGQEHINIRKGRAAIKRGSNPNAYRQGGATRRDLRIKSVKPENREIGRILVGVNKSRSHVGWRTKFITQGTKQRKTKRGQNRGRMTPNPFLQRSYDSTISFVRADFLQQYREAFVAWARSTWPQVTR